MRNVDEFSVGQKCLVNKLHSGGQPGIGIHYRASITETSIYASLRLCVYASMRLLKVALKPRRTLGGPFDSSLRTFLGP